MTIHISLDLETWGTEPGDDIRSIGACVFDPDKGTVGRAAPYNKDRPVKWPQQMWDNLTGNNPCLFYIACDNPAVSQYETFGREQAHHDGIENYRMYPLNRDPRTVQWWTDQTEAAQTAFANPFDLRECLERFTAWLYNVTRVNREETGNSNACLWSHGAHFDPPILAAAYDAVGLPVPWHYRAPRDTRTAFDLAGITDHSAHLAALPGPLGIQHHALDDAICQARGICAAYAQVQEWRNAWTAQSSEETP